MIVHKPSNADYQNFLIYQFTSLLCPTTSQEKFCAWVFKGLWSGIKRDSCPFFEKDWSQLHYLTDKNLFSGIGIFAFSFDIHRNT